MAAHHALSRAGAALTQAQSWVVKRAVDLPGPDREFIALSIAREKKTQARARGIRGMIYGLGAAVILGLVGWINQATIADEWRFLTVTWPYERAKVRPYVLSPTKEQALKPGDSFKECAQNCPEMVVIPAGEFIMGSPANEKGRGNDEEPQHKVVFAKPFAVSKFEVTFEEWDTCVDYGDCVPVIQDSGWGRGRQPMIQVTWEDAHSYVRWFSRMTGKPYRLLSEAEWEYAARAGTNTAYPWGDEIGKNNCNGCGSQSGRQTAPVGSFAPNAFGLYDMHGNVEEWLEDCWNDSYEGAPTDGSAWTAGDCKFRVTRGGAFNFNPQGLRSAGRGWAHPVHRDYILGLRIGRTLSP
jgi:formylglycine-generating enzyme required for sulfatase activity